MHVAGKLRKAPTPAELKLWSALRGNRLDGINFRRQHAIGKYIVDFCSPGHKLVIELDGGQHAELGEYDEQRTGFLVSQGYRVIRFWNKQVTGDIHGVLREILLTLEEIAKPKTATPVH